MSTPTLPALIFERTPRSIPSPRHSESSGTSPTTAKRRGPEVLYVSTVLWPSWSTFRTAKVMSSRWG